MLDQTITYVKSQLQMPTGEFVRVEYAFEADPIEKLDSDNIPALFLFPGTFEARGSASDNRIDQLEDMVLGTHMVCRIQDFEARRREVIATIMGYQFDQEAWPFLLVSGETKGIRASMIWWEEFYSAEAPAGR